LVDIYFSYVDVIDEDVPELLVALQKDDTAAMRPAVEVQAESSGDSVLDMDTYGDYHDDYDDAEDNVPRAIPEYKEKEDEPSTPESTEVYTAANCDLLKHEMDDRLGPFCALQPADLRRFVVQYLISRKVNTPTCFVATTILIYFFLLRHRPLRRHN
jgi:hypothetical protein